MGSKIVPEGLRRAGWRVVTMDERYGLDGSQHIADVDWIRDACDEGDVIVAKDRAIAKHPLEAEALVALRARAFIIASANITGPQMLDRLLANSESIERAANADGPFVWSVDLHRLQRIRIKLPRYDEPVR